MSAELKQLYREISELQRACSAKCEKQNGCDASCCYVSKMGGEPSLTDHEINLINGYLDSVENFTFYESGTDACKFLGTDGKCKIYSVRPADCRVHVCASERMESQDNSEVEDLVNDYHLRHPSSFYHSQLMYSCKFNYEESP